MLKFFEIYSELFKGERMLPRSHNVSKNIEHSLVFFIFLFFWTELLKFIAGTNGEYIDLFAFGRILQ